MSAICVYCGSNAGRNPRYAEATRRIGTLIAEGGHSIVYGGGNVGLMGILADAALAAGGEVIGVIPALLEKRELAHKGLTHLHTVSSMHERKALMAALSDCFLALPGGIGTLEEIIEVFVWTKLGIHPKTCGVLNTDGFYDGLLSFLKNMEGMDFLESELLAQLVVASDPADALERLTALPWPRPQTTTDDIALEA